MSRSTISHKFQITIPLDVRQALKLVPQQKVSYEVRPDGSVIMRPLPNLDQLFGSIKLRRPAASTHEEKQATQMAVARIAFQKARR